MKQEETVHPWPPNIHQYEQKFFGIPVMSFMGGGMAGVVTFMVFSQVILNGISGMIVGGIMALVAFGGTMLCMDPLGDVPSPSVAGLPDATLASE